MGNILNLPEFKEIKKEQNQHYYRITVECAERPDFCLQCMSGIEVMSMRGKGEFTIHSTKERIVSDIPMHGKLVKIVINHKRYKCPSCGKTFYEPFISIERNDKVTIRLKEYIQKLSLQKPFTQVAEETGVSHASVKRYFNEFISKQDKERYIKAPRVLGIDEAHLNKTMRGVLTDIENKRLIDILPNNLKKTVKPFIQSMDGYENIEVVTTDMWAGYRNAIYELIPNAVVVVDKFHVVQYAVRALDSIRVQVKKKLPKQQQRLITYDRWVLLKNKEDLSEEQIHKRDVWFEMFPELETAYWLKEMIRDIYKCPTIKEANQLFYTWECAIPDDFKEFKDIQKTFKRFRKEIFNYFNHPYTNAYTESVNNIIKSVEKAGKGYTFDVLRAKVLYGTNATKRPQYKDTNFYTFDKYTNGNSVGYREGFYVDLTTLSTILDTGEF